jgi:copper ion binding protein
MATETLQMPVHGMTCGNCVRSVERTLASIPGVTKVTVNLEGRSATVEYDKGVVTAEALAATVRDLGYEVPA